MPALVYRNTRTTLPNWVPIHDEQPRGLAYATDTHFVHFYGRERGMWVISPGLTVTERRDGELRDWVQQTFGAIEIQQLQQQVGDTVDGVWRPGLLSYDETIQGLGTTPLELTLAEQVLLLLTQRLDELLLFVEPTANNLPTHSSERTAHSRVHGGRKLLETLLASGKRGGSKKWQLHNQSVCPVARPAALD